MVEWIGQCTHVSGGMANVCVDLVGRLRFARWMYLFARRIVQAHVGWVGFMTHTDRRMDVLIRLGRYMSEVVG